MNRFILFICIVTQLHCTTVDQQTIEFTELQPHHISAAKDILYHIVHEFKYTDLNSIEEIVDLCAQHNICKDYDDPDAYYFNNRGTFLVVLENDKVIGTGGIKFFSDDTCELKRFYFTPEARGQGLATKLMQKLIAHAQERGYKKICLEIYRPQAQTAAVRFYTKWGFHEIPHYKETTALLSMEMELD
jgi:putative acetyltransferase